MAAPGAWPRFVAARDPSGHGALYGPPPWRFAGRSLTVIARCDAAAVRALLPAPLRPWGEPLVRFSVHSLICDLGHGWDWAQANPAASQLHESVVGIAAEHAGTIGYWDPFLWTDSDAEFAVGREMYGWPQRLGTLALTAPHPQRGWTTGDRCAGQVSRLGRAVLDAQVTLAASGPLPAPQPPFVGFFVERALPDPSTETLTRELFLATMREVKVEGHWHGPATLALHAPELAALAPNEILGGQVNTVSWIKGGATLVTRSTEPFPRPAWG
ncbi:MAG: acetoacetate decarboxylase family protein [Alphaproteobacteria bacterium]|nr:acetoacetate decarboxylase family protein [Alphaproteobacteria bacterium]